jgi:steroid delta-isomerase-like uncharacterized protein
MAEATTAAEEVVTEYISCTNDREFTKLPDVAAESLTFTSPTEGTIRGRENVEAYLRGIVAGFSDFHITVHETLADGELVMCENTLTGTHDGEFDGIPPTQEEVELPEMVTFVVDDGMVQEERVYYDHYDLLNQLGLVDE